MIQEIFLKLNWPDWVLLLCVIGLTLISYLFYFNTLPPLSRIRRAVLIVCRSAALAILLFLILEPVVQLFQRYREKPVVALLLDNSASMSIKDRKGVRGDSLKLLLREALDLNDSLEVDLFLFDVAARRLKDDSLSFKKDGSNLSQAIQTAIDSCSGKNLQAVFLVSDGIYNQGTNPLMTVANSPVPVHTVLIGDPENPEDVAIRRVQTNQIVYANKTLPVEVVIWQNGYDRQPALLEIYRKNKRITKKMVTLGKSGLAQKEELMIRPEKVGDFDYTVRIQVLPEEITPHNNQQTFQLKVLKRKINILALSGAPNFDRHFLACMGRELKDYQFTFLTEKASGKYFEQPFNKVALDSQDVFIFHGFPTAKSDASQLAKLFRQIEQQHMPVFWLISHPVSWNKLKPFIKQVPFQINGTLKGVEKQFVQLTPLGRQHPITRLKENNTENELLWKALPPLEVFENLELSDKVKFLMMLKNSGNLQDKAAQEGNCAIYQHQKNKQLIFNGANLGNWFFQLQHDSEREQLAVQFMDRTVRWLVNRDDLHQIQVRPSKPRYNVGEAVLFSGELYDEFYQPLEDGRVTVKIKNDILSITDEMIAEPEGHYRQLFPGLPEGKFEYEIEAYHNEKKLGTRTGKLTIEPFFMEFEQVAANAELMRQIAQKGGGAFFTITDFIPYFSQTQLESRVQYRTSEYLVWSTVYWLIPLILLLGSEWFLRKRWGLL